MKRFAQTLYVITTAFCLSACGGGGPSAPTPPINSAPPQPPVQQSEPNLVQNKLLSDEEMRTSEIMSSGSVKAEAQSWVEANHFPIRSAIYDEDFSDLAFLNDLIGDRSVVQLGESSHGTAEFNHLKTRMIKYLHQEKGFNVVAFESGFFEGVYSDSIRATGSGDELMRFIFGVWNTNEVIELFRYVSETQSGPSPLRLAGFDIQISSPYYSRLQAFIGNIPESETLTDSFKQELIGNARQVQALQTDFQSQDCFSSSFVVSAACRDIANDMSDLKDVMLRNSERLAAIPDQDRDITILGIALYAATQQLDYSPTWLLRGMQISSELRDLGMATVFDRLMNDLFPNEKIVIWAHNGHIRHAQSPLTVVSGNGNLLDAPFGSYLKSSIPDDLYTIGLFMLRGETADNSGRSLAVEPPRNDSLEAIAHSVRKAGILIESSPDLERVDGNAFLFEPTRSHIWGGSFGTYSFVPSDQFDAMIFIDKSSVPRYR